MPKKARVKGKGHEIFFEEKEGLEETVEKASPEPSKPRRKAEGLSHAEKTQRQAARTPAKQPTGKTAKQPVSAQVEISVSEPASPVKATFYLRPDQVEELESLFTTVRSRHGIRVGKSEIVRVALDMVFAEYKARLEESSILPKLKREEEEEQKRRQKGREEEKI